MHRHPRPAHQARRPARQPRRPRSRPATHGRVHPSRLFPRARPPAPGRVGAHARIPRPLLHQEPPLLDHPHRTPRCPRRAPARTGHRRRAHARLPGQRHDPRCPPLELLWPRSRDARRLWRGTSESAMSAKRIREQSRPETDRLLTVAQAAALLATSERFPRRLIAERRIRFVRLGENGKRGHVRIPESALPELIAAGAVEPLTVADVCPPPWRASVWPTGPGPR